MKRYRKKVMLLGDGAVGKTSLVRRYVYNTFSDHYIATIGAKTCTKDVDYEEHGIALNMVIWDIIGQQGFERTQMVNMREDFKKFSMRFISSSLPTNSKSSIKTCIALKIYLNFAISTNKQSCICPKTY